MRRQDSGHSGLSVQTGMSGRDGAPPSPKPQDWEANEEASECDAVFAFLRRAHRPHDAPCSVGALRTLDARSRTSRQSRTWRIDADITRTPSQTHWEAGETADPASVDSPKDGFAGATGTAKVAGAPKGDESDPLGLMRGGILA